MGNKRNAVFITGTSSGIGKELVNVFTNNNCFVIGIARRMELLNNLKDSLGERGDLFLPFQLDINNKKEFDSLLEKITDEFIIDCLINNAGITSFKKVLEDSFEDIEQIINTNLLSPLYIIKKILPSMVKNNDGSIINIQSVVTKKIFTASSAYSASKAGLLAYTNVLREELRDSNIRVINILPGATATEIWPTKSLEKYGAKMMNSKNIAEIIFRLYSEKSNLVTEELVLRPITGDL